FQAEDGMRDFHVTGVQTCALPIWALVLCRRGGAPPRSGGYRPGCSSGHARGSAATCSLLGFWSFTATLHKAVEHRGLAVLLTREIGRASWRERGQRAGRAGG